MRVLPKLGIGGKDDIKNFLKCLNTQTIIVTIFKHFAAFVYGNNCRLLFKRDYNNDNLTGIGSKYNNTE